MGCGSSVKAKYVSNSVDEQPVATESARSTPAGGSPKSTEVDDGCTVTKKQDPADVTIEATPEKIEAMTEKNDATQACADSDELMATQGCADSDQLMATFQEFYVSLLGGPSATVGAVLETSHDSPSLEEYKHYLGFNLETDENYVWICDSLKSEPIPPQFSQCVHSGLVYWVDRRNMEATWKHPLYDKYAAMLVLARERKPALDWKSMMSFRIEFLVRSLCFDLEEKDSHELLMRKRALCIGCMWEMSRIASVSICDEPYLVHPLISCLCHFHAFIPELRLPNKKETAAMETLLVDYRRCTNILKELVGLLKIAVESRKADEELFILDLPLLFQLGCKSVPVYSSPHLEHSYQEELPVWAVIAAPNENVLKICHPRDQWFSEKFVKRNFEHDSIWRSVADPDRCLEAMRSHWFRVYMHGSYESTVWGNISTGGVTALSPMTVNEPPEEVKFALLRMKEGAEEAMFHDVAADDAVVESLPDTGLEDDILPGEFAIRGESEGDLSARLEELADEEMDKDPLLEEFAEENEQDDEEEGL